MVVARKIKVVMLVLILVGTLLLAGCNVNIGTFEETNIQGNNEAIEWNEKGYAFTNQGKYSEAIECYDKAIAIDPNVAVVW
ncbi:MAG: tetratricopeptide repeat protein, partial [Candidatus Methanofastidiosa archaeon]|nr:tetratricopeptide repeat protein [Candidatus Methanofastidiosa archaeon]